MTEPQRPPPPAAGGDGHVYINPAEVPLTAVEIDVASLSVCAFDTKSDRYDCGVAPTAVLIQTGVMATHGTAAFTADVSRGCVGAVQAEIALGAAAGRIDFPSAIGTEGGITRPLKPSLVSAPVPVSPGTRAVETLRPPAGCLGTPTLLGERDQVTIEVPYTVDGRPARAMWVRRRERKAVEPRVLLEQIPEPERPGAALEDKDREALDAPWMLGTPLGAAAGVAATLGGVALGAALLPRSRTNEQLAQVGGFFGVVGAVVVGVPATGAGAIFDAVRHAAWESEREQREERELKARMHGAWLRRLSEDEPD